MADATLYDRLGGEPAVGAVVNELYDRVLADERVAHHSDDVDVSAQRSHQTTFLSAVTGGPLQYEGDDTEAAHGGLAITGAEFDAVARPSRRGAPRVRRRRRGPRGGNGDGRGVPRRHRREVSGASAAGQARPERPRPSLWLPAERLLFGAGIAT